ncbi:MAG: hypothetical protein LUG56_07610 [Lachnospiraceae bacterium]|nr:hypothetical protein [Lachnospiraceae bacterium]
MKNKSITKRIIAAMMALLLFMLTPADAMLCSAAEVLSETAEDSDADAGISTLEEDEDEDTDAGVSTFGEDEDTDAGASTFGEDEDTDAGISTLEEERDEDEDTDVGISIESIEDVTADISDESDESTAAADEEAASHSGYCGPSDDTSALKWTLDDDGVLTISGTGAMADYDASESKYAS